MLRTAFLNVRQTRAATVRSFADADKSMFEKAKETVGEQFWPCRLRYNGSVASLFKSFVSCRVLYVESMAMCAGKMTEKVSEPFKEDGAIGKQFNDTEEGSAGVTCHLYHTTSNSKAKCLYELFTISSYELFIISSK